MSEIRSEEAVVRETVKKTWKGEMAKLRTMSFGQKAEYIFEYYKIQIALILAAVAVVVYIIMRIVTYREPVFYVMVANSPVFNQERIENVTEYLGIPAKDEEVVYLGDVSSQPMAGGGMPVVKTDLHMAAREIDVCFADEDATVRFAASEALRPVETMMSSELYELWKDRVVDFEVYDAENSEYLVNEVYVMKPVAIDISGTNVHKYFGLDEKTKYFLPFNFSGHDDNYEKFLEMIYEIETGKIQ